MPLTHLVVLLVIFVPVFSKTTSRPSQNVLILIADDAGFESTVYGNKVIETPGQQWLANHGLTFTNAFTAVSSCSPSRASILTGLPPHQNGMYGLHHREHHFNCFDKVQSLPKILKKHHITTGIIGKKHVGPETVFPFDYAETEENNSILQVGRNITRMNYLVQEFLNLTKEPFFLYIGFHDPHRCGHTHPEFGSFCEKFGNGQPGMGMIPDWNPKHYKSDEVLVPYFVPDTPAARADIAAQYTSINRMDQGIRLILEEFHKRNLLNRTLIVYTSDNGIPFPSGRTNLYDPGMREPLIVVNPLERGNSGKKSNELVSLLDVTPTVLEWFNVMYPKYKIFKSFHNVRLTGRSLLKNFCENYKNSRRNQRKCVFSSHSLHEISMYYPMRVVRMRRYKLLHNLNYHMPFPIDQDFYISPTFQDLLNRSIQHLPTNWYKNISGYYYRDEYELYDTLKDPRELKNLAKFVNYKKMFWKLKSKLFVWRNITDDPWICSPENVLEAAGKYKHAPQCMPLYNDHLL